MVGHEVGVERRAHGGLDARGVEDVLDSYRHAVKGASLSASSLGTCLLAKAATSGCRSGVVATKKMPR